MHYILFNDKTKEIYIRYINDILWYIKDILWYVNTS